MGLALQHVRNLARVHTQLVKQLHVEVAHAHVARQTLFLDLLHAGPRLVDGHSPLQMRWDGVGSIPMGVGKSHARNLGALVRFVFKRQASALRLIGEGYVDESRRPVHQVHVKVVEVQVIQSPFECGQDVLLLVVRVVELRGNKEVLPLHVSRRNARLYCIANFVFVEVVLGAINHPAPISYKGLHCLSHGPLRLLRAIPRSRECADADEGHACP
mmetsp:Transcript_23979/g.47012  ORF Transcript_23979/g.47012 Transcript_23979/m.47012 type:complete len:215 (-) Transcript_23979:128-772(-)